MKLVQYNLGCHQKMLQINFLYFKNQFDSLWRKHGSYSVGEDLFGLDHTEQSGSECLQDLMEY